MSKFQLWSRDEYGQGSILMTSEDINEVVKKAREEVTEINVRNALTETDRERNWEAYMIDIQTSGKKKKTKYVYGSTDVHTKNRVYAVTDDKVKQIVLDEVPQAVVRIYLGNISANRNDEKDWFAKDARQNVIETADHADLQGKISFFVKELQ
jgi:hypothetical protein